jgi:A/G-specific adenine glycosylase
LYLVPSDGQHTWLQQRMEKDIWQNLWEFPLIETSEALSSEQQVEEPRLKTWFGDGFVLGKSLQFKHILSHRVIHATFLPVRIQHSEHIPTSWTKVSFDKIDTFAVSRMTENFLIKASYR